MKPSRTLLPLLFAASLICVIAQDTPPSSQPFSPGRPPQPVNGPWNHDVLVFRFLEGAQPEHLFTFPRAGVPTLARLADGRLIAAFQHFPENDARHFDRVAVSFSSDEGRTWTAPAPIEVQGMEEGLARPFDPALVPLPGGRVRLYFTSNRNRDFRLSTPQIYSAISTDGIAYTFEPGVRFGIEGRIVIDCAVVLHQGVFHLYAPDNGTAEAFFENERQRRQPPSGTGYHATSPDGLTFTRSEDVRITGGEGERWLGNAQSSGGKIAFFGTGSPRMTPGEPPRGGGVWMARSADGSAWDGVTATGIMGADPGAVAGKEGGWITAVTGPPRNGRHPGEPGFPSALPRPPNPGQAGFPPQKSRPLTVERIETGYEPAAKGSAGSFRTGQSADTVLGAFGFNQSGGPLALNHPTGLATDGQRLLVADRWNNRVLIWTKIPASNEPPQIVLGQPGFATNDPGPSLNQLNWPGNVSVGGNGRLAVTDTNNDRILLWNSFPETSGQAADLALRLRSFRSAGDRMPLTWPWGVWTDGNKLAAVATQGGAVLIWNNWPRNESQGPDLILRPAAAGTPRNITSDGTFLMVSDHNHKGSQRPGPHPQNQGPMPSPQRGGGGGLPGGPATMVWNQWPASPDQEPDFVLPEWNKGTPTPGNGLILAGIQSISLWSRRPLHASTPPDLRLQPRSYTNGDGPDAVVAAGRLFVCNYNGSNILAWNTIPKADGTPPDFALGSSAPDEDVWAKRFWIQNPVVATDGASLFASSDFDRKLFVWRKLPGESGAFPDLVYHLPQGPWDNGLHGTKLVLGGRDTLYIWTTLPLDGELPTITFQRRIGTIDLHEVTGVAIDDRHLYVADRGANRVYAWKGIPAPAGSPLHVLEVSNPGRMSSDGTWLTVAPFEGQEILFYRVANLSAPPLRLGGRGKFNLPGKAIVAGDRLFVADTSFHRVAVWNDVAAALNEAPADAYLGAQDETDRTPGIGRASLFMPGSLAYDGANLWVGEFKFSTRILRFRPVTR